jgi:hypothetical protein
MPYLYLSLVVAFLCIAAACVVAERKSRAHYHDPLLIRMSGFFTALAFVAFGFWVHAIL